VNIGETQPVTVIEPLEEPVPAETEELEVPELAELEEEELVEVPA
jgi:hypothetical protein